MRHCAAAGHCSPAPGAPPPAQNFEHKLRVQRFVQRREFIMSNHPGRTLALTLVRIVRLTDLLGCALRLRLWRFFFLVSCTHGYGICMSAARASHFGGSGLSLQSLHEPCCQPHFRLHGFADNTTSGRFHLAHTLSSIDGFSTGSDSRTSLMLRTAQLTYRS